VSGIAASPPPEVYADLVRRALAEDVGRGDLTSALTVDADARARGTLVAKRHLVVAGLDVAAETFRQCDPQSVFEVRWGDGSLCERGETIAIVTGLARSLLTAERTALNFLQRLSGIATLTRRFVDAADRRITVLDTRKTTPTFRDLEKYAVRCGGGFNHRFGLDDAILIKDNHIAVAGGIRAVLERARAAAGHLVKIEIEVDTLDQLREVLKVGLADAVLLDNMDPGTLRKAVEMVGGKFPLEASGGITLDTIAAVAASGVDYASSGWITHSAPNLDVALDIEI
jgi:nicotinate-nucleotide pyrophosphorylase (carboxylating)